MKRKSIPVNLSDTQRARDSMMASPCNLQYFLNRRLFPWLLALVLTMTWPFSVTESMAQIQLRGEVGGNVTIHCPIAKHKTITFFYFQKGEIFVNGYHASKNISDSVTWENTRVGHDKTTVHMYNLNVSHSGDYQCLIQYNDSPSISDTVIHLSVTANYSKPEIRVWCSDSFSCLVTCASHGGYPRTKMEWSVPGSPIWRVVNNSEMSDPNTMVSISSTAYFNCSNGELNYLSCSVGDVTSDVFSVCTPKDAPVSQDLKVILTAICAVVFFTIIVVSLLWKYKKGHTGAAAVDVRQEWGVNGRNEEAVELYEKKGGEETS